MRKKSSTALTDHRFYFQLRPSLLKVLLVVFIFTLLCYLLMINVGNLWAIVITTLCIILALLFRQKTYYTKLGHLDGDIWIIQDQHQNNSERTLQSIQQFGLFICLYFDKQHSQDKMLSICIAQDQLSSSQWSRLQRISRNFK